MRRFIVFVVLSLTCLSSAHAASVSIMIGDNDGYGTGVPDNGLISPLPIGYDRWSSSAALASDGSEITDVYAAHNPAFVPNSASIASIFFPFLGMLDSATLTIDVAGVELAAPSPAFAVDINGVGIAFPVVGSFNQSSVLAYSLTGSMLAAANAAGEVVLTIDRNGSPDWIAFDYFALNGETVSPVPIPAAAWLFASALGVFGYLGKRKANA